MTCPNCRTTVPDESLFCLRCGAQLQLPPRRAPRNGGATARPAVQAAPAAPAARGRPAAPATAKPPAPAGAPPEGKHAYALAFRPLRDERLRYRVARWVCDQAPAHPLAEVQQGLQRGDFSTFLALTEEEAEAARQHIQALGAHPALWRLSPATAADMLVPERPARPTKAEWSPQKKIAAVVIGLLALFLFGTFAALGYFSTVPTGLQPGTMPTIGEKP